MNTDFDVAIIGGGPGGSTVGTLLAKYNPRLKIAIFERETFPRDHIGESQLPLICRILHEMEVWDKVEAAGFPIKVGGTYRWGRTNDLWDFDFIPNGRLNTMSRPSTFTGQRQSTAFQVDRAIYDEILLNHAAEMGCSVEQGIAVREILKAGDRIEGFVLEDGRKITARYYIDASGGSGILRRAMGVEQQVQSNLQNIAIWNYWTNAEWAVTIGFGGTRIQVLAQKVGWIWFIPLGHDRTSIGYVVPVEHYKSQGKRTDEIYYEALQGDRIVSTLTRNASHEEKVRTTRDWSYVCDRLTGENWFLVGECAGFADPILSAGMSLAHAGAREVAYAILAMDRGDYEPEWLKTQYCNNHRSHIRQHIQFADFWYTAKESAFPDLREHTRGIAQEAGLEMTAEEAWQWFGQGGFIDSSGNTDIGFFGPLAAKELISSFSGEKTHFDIEGKTHFRLDLEGAEKDWAAELSNGKVSRHRSYRRGAKTLPLVKTIGWIALLLKQERSYAEIKEAVMAHGRGNSMTPEAYRAFWSQVVSCLEVLVGYGWVVATTVAGAEACPKLHTGLEDVFHPNRDVSRLLAED